MLARTQAFCLDDYPTVSECRAADRFVVQEVTAKQPRHQPFVTTTDVPAIRVSVALLPVASNDYSLAVDGRTFPAHDIARFDATVVDLDAAPTTWSRGEYAFLHFVLRRSALDLVAEDLGYRRVGNIRTVAQTNDLVMSQIARVATKLFGAAATELSLDELEMIAAAHVVQHYGAVRRAGTTAAAMLPKWKQRRAEAMIEASLDGTIRLEDLARECELSVSHFARAFRATYGMSAHRWLVERRIDRAKQLLARPDVTLTEVATLTGFTDQSVFTRAFRRLVGTTPGTWRRETARKVDP